MAQEQAVRRSVAVDEWAARDSPGQRLASRPRLAAPWLTAPPWRCLVWSCRSRSCGRRCVRFLRVYQAQVWIALVRRASQRVAEGDQRTSCRCCPCMERRCRRPDSTGKRLRRSTVSRLYRLEEHDRPFQGPRLLLDAYQLTATDQRLIRRLPHERETVGVQSL